MKVLDKVIRVLYRIIGALQILSAGYILYLREPVTYSWFTAFIISLFMGLFLLFCKITSTDKK